jgi:3-phosphoshikimate 1-carboxyvinyltransferase
MLIEQRDSLRGEITVPGDKSISHRAIIFGAFQKVLPR